MQKISIPLTSGIHTHVMTHLSGVTDHPMNMCHKHFNYLPHASEKMPHSSEISATFIKIHTIHKS